MAEEEHLELKFKVNRSGDESVLERTLPRSTTVDSLRSLLFPGDLGLRKKIRVFYSGRYLDNAAFSLADYKVPSGAFLHCFITDAIGQKVVPSEVTESAVVTSETVNNTFPLSTTVFTIPQDSSNPTTGLPTTGLSPEEMQSIRAALGEDEAGLVFSRLTAASRITEEEAHQSAWTGFLGRMRGWRPVANEDSRSLEDAPRPQTIGFASEGPASVRGLLGIGTIRPGISEECRNGFHRDLQTVWPTLPGMACGACFYPWGLFCCFLHKIRRCPHCGHTTHAF